VYGGREIREGTYATLIAIFKERMRRGESLPVREPGTQLRNYTHIDDIIDGLVLVGEKGEGDDFVIAHDQPYSVLEVAKLFGGKVEMIPNRPGNRLDSVADTSRIRALGWNPKRTLAQHVRDFLDSLSSDAPRAG
jgi:UDP-glucose 4-epimerase